VSARRENLVTLSAPFWEELKKHPIPVDADVVRVLANNLSVAVKKCAILAGKNAPAVRVRYGWGPAQQMRVAGF
jgi:hypothetical protein